MARAMENQMTGQQKHQLDNNNYLYNDQNTPDAKKYKVDNSQDSGFVDVEEEDVDSRNDGGAEENEIVKDRVFSNDLIWRKLGRYLSHSDLKSLRLVNKKFNTAILDSTHFIRRTLVNLSRDDSSILLSFSKTCQLWKHFKLQYHPHCLLHQQQKEGEKEDEDTWSWFYPFLTEAESYIIITRDFNNNNNNNENNCKSAPFSLIKLIEAPDSLQKLVIQIDVLAISSALFELQEITFSSTSRKFHTVLRNLQEFHLLRKLDSFALEKKTNLLKSLPLLFPLMKNLKVVSLHKLYNCLFHSKIELKERDELLLEISVVGLVTNLIHKNRNTLAHLHGYDMFTFTLLPPNFTVDPGHNLLLPKLKTLGIRSYKYNTENMIYFLRQQPELEELDIIVLPTFPIELLNAIEEKTVDAGGRLKKLRISTKGFTSLQPGLFDFLKNLNHLEHFHLNLVQSKTHEARIDSFKSILTSLPKSIREISLRLKNFNNNGKREIITASDFVNVNPNILSYLSLVDINSAVSDETMEFICRNFKRLQHLNVIGSTQTMTNYGMTGIRKKYYFFSSAPDTQEPEFSLKDLKGLKALGISTGGLSDTSLINAVRFLELKHFKLVFPNIEEFDQTMITSAGIVSVLKHNPSLERIIEPVGIYFFFLSPPEFMKWCPRLQEESPFDDDRYRRLFDPFD